MRVVRHGVVIAVTMCVGLSAQQPEPAGVLAEMRQALGARGFQREFAKPALFSTSR